MYRKGDIVFVNFPFSNGSKFKPRPALILSGKQVNKTGDCIFVQITSNTSWDDGLTVPLQLSDLRTGRLPKVSVVRFHKLFTGNEELIVAKLGSVSRAFREKVARRIQRLIL